MSSNSFIKTGGTSSQFLKADGSVDSSTYTPTSRTLTINGTTYDLTADRSWSVGTVVASDLTPYAKIVSPVPITIKDAPTFSYTSSKLTGISYADGTTKTITYNGDGTFHQLVVQYPAGGATITKTAVYTGGVLTSLSVV